MRALAHLFLNLRRLPQVLIVNSYWFRTKQRGKTNGTRVSLHVSVWIKIDIQNQWFLLVFLYFPCNTYSLKLHWNFVMTIPLLLYKVNIQKKKIEVSSWQPIQNGSGDTLLHKTLKKHLLALIHVFSDVNMHRLLERWGSHIFWIYIMMLQWLST